MLDFGEKLINFGSFSKRLSFLEDGKHLLHGIKELAEGKCMLALVMEGRPDPIGIRNVTSRVAFACIMVMQSDHVTTTILMTCQMMNPVLNQFALKKTA